MMMNPNPRAIGVIGAGVMGEALISALISAGVSPQSITVSEKRDDRGVLTHVQGIGSDDMSGFQHLHGLLTNIMA